MNKIFYDVQFKLSITPEDEHVFEMNTTDNNGVTKLRTVNIVPKLTEKELEEILPIYQQLELSLNVLMTQMESK